MGDRLDEIRERWARWPKFDIGEDGELWAGDVRLGNIDAGGAAEAIAAAPSDVAWLLASLVGARDLRATAERERDESRGALDALALAREQDRQRLTEERDAALAALAAEQRQHAAHERMRDEAEAENANLAQGATGLYHRSERALERAERAEARVAALEAVLAEWEPYVDTRELDIDVPGGLDRYERAVANLRQRAGTPTLRPALTRAEVEAALERADRSRVAVATCELIEADGPRTKPETEDRLVVDLVCAVLGVPDAG